MGSVASGATVSEGRHGGAKSLDVAPDAPRAPAAGALGVADVRPCGEDQWTSFCTLPDLMQPVQAWTRFGAPSTTARTRWMLGFHRRFVRRCEWLTLMPHDGCLPHTSQTAAMTRHLGFGLDRTGK